MGFWDLKIRRTSIKFGALALVQLLSLVYLYATIGSPLVDEKAKSGVALTGLFVLVVFVIAFGKVYYQKTASNNIKKKEEVKLKAYDTANMVQWVCLILCFWAGGYFYLVRKDISYFGICFASFAFFIYSFPSMEKFKKDFM